MAPVYWRPEEIWHGETCFVLAGGPSLTQDIVDRLHGRRVITINSSVDKARHAGVDDGALYFTDTAWFMQYRNRVAAWRGLVVTVSPTAAKAMPDKVRLVEAPLRGDFPGPGAGVIRGGRTSGHKAISLGIAFGCQRVVLLGFDMRVVDGRSHHHDDYVCRDPEIYALDFIPSFWGWDDAARKLGIDILNATPGSALKEFKVADLDRILEGFS